jgi:hypothetical protein
MVLSFPVLGSMFADTIHWDRVAAIALIYLLGLGVGAHALDALGGGASKPWGNVFTRSGLWLAAALSLMSAYGIAAYYMFRYVPVLWSVAILEGFFVFAYNLEWFGGRFHTDRWFAFSWGFLPVLAGCIMQTNRITLGAIVTGSAASLLSLVEIKASRPYKELKQRPIPLGEADMAVMERYEAILRCISLGVILLGAGLAIGRIAGG